MYLREDNEDSLPDAPEPRAILLPAFQWDSGVPLPSQSESDNLPFPPVQPPSPPHTLPAQPRARTVTTPVQKPKISTPIFEGYIVINHITDEATKILLFSTFISAGSDADVWWANLGTQEKSTWALAKAAFLVKWPVVVVAGKTQREYQKDLLELRFKEEDVGERVMVAGIATWAHVQFHNKLKTLVKDAGVESVPILIQPVREALPRALRDLTSASPADWATFLNKIKNVNVDTLQEKAKRAKERKEAEKAQNARIARLENRQDPIEVLCLQMQQTSIGTNTPAPRVTSTPPSTTTSRRQVRYVTANQAPTNQRLRGQPPTQEERDALRACINELQHHADSDAGHAAYGEQLRQWMTKWGEGARCTEKTPFPLTPGAAQICSGECFRCGVHGHIGPMCPLPADAQLLKNETDDGKVHHSCQPFLQHIACTGPQGEVVRVKALFDEGAMVSAMCTTVFDKVQHRLGNWQASTKQLRMANGTLVPSKATWRGEVTIAGVRTQGEFEVFDSGGGWRFLFGKPMLHTFKAIHEYETDTVQISGNGVSTTIHNQNQALLQNETKAQCDSIPANLHESHGPNEPKEGSLHREGCTNRQ
ncbi:hypothetical protein EDB19DRAFT_1834464 [Suillus lakei]|nr:hypothetical protein EDB19DRAFT_1834464 [Suillus lakei]